MALRAALLGLAVLETLCLASGAPPVATFPWDASVRGRQALDKHTDRPLKLSSYNCTNEADFKTNVCVFTNLVRWNNRLYYLTEKKQDVKLPRVGINQKRPDSEASALIQVMPLLDLALELGQASRQHLQYRYGIIWHPELVVNWWHHLDDATIMYFPWCEGLGLCKFSKDVAETSAVLFHNPGWSLSGVEKEWKKRGSSSFKELLQCYGTRLLNVQSIADRSEGNAEDAMDNVVFSFDRVVVGMGTATGHGWQAERFGVRPPSTAERLGLMGYLRECAGLEPMPRPVQRQPNVMLLNRAYATGRSMLRLDEVEYRVRTQRPAANTSIVFLEGYGFKAQAAAFASADVVVLAHGAACSNLLFLPQVAGVVHVSDSPAQQGFQDDILGQMPPPYQIINIPYTHDTNDYLEPIPHVIRHTDEFTHKRDTPQSKLDLVFGDGEEERGYRMFNRMANYLLDVDEVTEKVVRAIDQWAQRNAALLKEEQEAAQKAQQQQEDTTQQQQQEVKQQQEGERGGPADAAPPPPPLPPPPPPEQRLAGARGQDRQAALPKRGGLGTRKRPVHTRNRLMTKRKHT